ncbi:MtrB/PioB family decaheme-associated outer membrane protein [Thiomonas sp. FB-6]|uniref:MtrB/PioB family decaheme-associated outer membrane protein n=1 Tax=Thiomonas sp. FB-6 TaxID=1158291 RepID=UPI000365B28A|nr:MtrB/PioB family decaheme-associated outer membrane protein [Thiomonas sp. FB-6]
MSNAKVAPRASTLSLAVQAALAALSMLSLATAARADDDLNRLVRPTSQVEVGGAYTQHASSQFGQYNGLYDSGASLIGNIDLLGGDSYGQQPGTMRWSVDGSNLGLSSRSLDANVTDQGHWKIDLGYDQLRHEISNSYQTPLVGSGNSYTMPPGFGIVSKARGSLGTQALTPTQQGFFHTQNLYSQRGTTHFGAEHDFGPGLDLRFHWTHIEQSGDKLIGSGSDAQTTSAAFVAAGYKPGNEAVQLLANPTSSHTDNFDLALDWRNQRGFATLVYAGSRYHDDYSALYFSNPYTSSVAANGTVLPGANPYPVDLLGTPPSNENNELKLSGGYDLSSATRLTGGLSYGRNTQNMGFAYEPAEMQSGTTPVGSLDGLVVNTHADARLSHRATQALTLAAGVVYNKRDNRTPSYTYPFYTLGGDAASPVNVPESYSHTVTDVTADYRLSPAQNLHAALSNDTMHRWCNNLSAVALAETLAAAKAGYYTDVSCMQVPSQRDNKLDLNYRVRAAENLNFRVGYAFADRKATVNPSFYNPMQSFSEGFENYGYLAYFQASRRENLLRAGVNWEPTQAMSLSLDGFVTQDSYLDSALGVQNGHSANLNAEADYRFSEQTTGSLYASWQWRTRALLSATGRNALSTTGLTDWTNDLRDQALTLGLSAKRSGMLADKLTLKADLSYQIDTTRYTTAAATGFTCNTGGTSGYNCGAVPDIRNELLRLRLSGEYKLDRRSTFLFGYLHEKLNSNDYLYNFYQLGYTSTSVMPANLADPSYSQNVLFLAYRYSFM